MIGDTLNFNANYPFQRLWYRTNYSTIVVDVVTSFATNVALLRFSFIGWALLIQFGYALLVQRSQNKKKSFSTHIWNYCLQVINYLNIGIFQPIRSKIWTSNNMPLQTKLFLGATFNVSTSVKSIESPLSDVIQNDLQSRKEDRRSPSLSNFSSDKDKLSLGKFCIIMISF